MTTVDNAMRALENSLGGWLVGEPGYEDEQAQALRAAVRAVLVVMREPTQVMARAIYERKHYIYPSGEPVTPLEFYQAGIDCALAGY